MKAQDWKDSGWVAQVYGTETYYGKGKVEIHPWNDGTDRVTLIHPDIDSEAGEGAFLRTTVSKALAIASILDEDC